MGLACALAVDLVKYFLLACTGLLFTYLKALCTVYAVPSIHKNDLKLSASRNAHVQPRSSILELYFADQNGPTELTIHVAILIYLIESCWVKL